MTPRPIKEIEFLNVPNNLGDIYFKHFYKDQDLSSQKSGDIIELVYKSDHSIILASVQWAAVLNCLKRSPWYVVHSLITGKVIFKVRKASDEEHTSTGTVFFASIWTPSSKHQDKHFQLILKRISKDGRIELVGESVPIETMAQDTEAKNSSKATEYSQKKSTDDVDKTLLMHAENGDCFGMLRSISNKEDIHKSDNKGKTALIYACENGNIYAVMLLLIAGAAEKTKCKNSGIHTIDLSKKNAITYAYASKSKDKEEIIKLLIHHGASQIAWDQNNAFSSSSSSSSFSSSSSASTSSAVVGGVVNSNDNICTTTVEASNDCRSLPMQATLPQIQQDSQTQQNFCDVKDVNGQTALMRYCLSGDIIDVKAALVCGADLRVTNSQGHTAAFLVNAKLNSLHSAISVLKPEENECLLLQQGRALQLEILNLLATRELEVNLLLEQQQQHHQQQYVQHHQQPLMNNMDHLEEAFLDVIYSEDSNSVTSDNESVSKNTIVSPTTVDQSSSGYTSGDSSKVSSSLSRFKRNSDSLSLTSADNNNNNSSSSVEQSSKRKKDNESNDNQIDATAKEVEVASSRQSSSAASFDLTNKELADIWDFDQLLLEENSPLFDNTNKSMNNIANQKKDKRRLN